jgi:hypothetical protein
LATKHERAIEQYGDILAQNLGYACIASVKDVIDALTPHGAVPNGVDLTGASLVVLSIRAAIDLEAISNNFGERALELMLDALDKHYSEAGLVTVRGGFRAWVQAARNTMAAHGDPRGWVRAHSVATLNTRDPEDEVFHLALVGGLTAGSPLWSEIETAANRGN